MVKALQTPKLPQGDVHYDNERGFAIILPKGWVAVAGDNATFMASSEAVWKAAVLPSPLVTMIVGPLDDVLGGSLAKARTANEVLLIAAGALSKDWQVKVGSVTEIEVNGYPAAAGVIEDANAQRTPQLAGQCVGVLLDGRAAVIWALGPKSQWKDFAPTLDAMLASIAFTQPSVAVRSQPTPTQPPVARPVATKPAAVKPPPAAPPSSATRTFSAPQDLYTNEAEHYSLLVPKGWRVMADGGTFTIASTVDDFSAPVPAAPLIEVTTGSLSTLYDGAAKGTTGPGPLLEVAIRVQTERGISVLGGQQAVDVDGHAGLIVDLSGAGLRGQLLVVYLGSDRACLMGALAPENQWADFYSVFQAMATSLKFNVK